MKKNERFMLYTMMMFAVVLLFGCTARMQFQARTQTDILAAKDAEIATMQQTITHLKRKMRENRRDSTLEKVLNTDVWRTEELLKTCQTDLSLHQEHLHEASALVTTCVSDLNILQRSLSNIIEE